MAIHFLCRRCRHPLSVRRRLAGSPVLCPNCKGETLAPSASETARPTRVVVPPAPAAPPAPITEPPRLGILVPPPAPPRPQPLPVSAPAPVPVAKPVPLPPPCPVPPPRRPFLAARRRHAALAGVAVLLLAAGLGAYCAWPRSSAPAPTDDTAVAESPAPAADDDPGDLLAALAPGEEEWLDDRPLPDAPEDPAQPVTGPAPGIDGPEPSAVAHAEVPPLPQPGALAKFKRRQTLAEDDLRRQLVRIPEIGLDRARLPNLVWEHKQQQEASMASYGEPDLSPAPLYDLYPGINGLAIRHGREAQLDSRRAATLDALSRKLRVYVARLAPADPQGKRPGAAQLRAVMYAEMRGRKPEWLRPEAIPVLMQMLTSEDVLLRRLLVEILAEIKHASATSALARRAVCDLDADVRAFAIDALRNRPREEYRDVLLRALRHPLPMLADHAAEALVALDVRDAVPSLVAMLKEPDPAAAYPGRDGRPLVREVVRTNHLANCLLCHPPSVTYTDPVPGVVPNSRWMYPVVSITPTLVERAGFVPVNGRFVLPQTPVVPKTPVAPAHPVTPTAPAPHPNPGPAPQPNPTPAPNTHPTQPSSPKAQQIVNFVNSITRQTTTTGTTQQTGCHDYSADIGLVNLVTVPSNPPPPANKKTGQGTNKPGNPPPTQPATPSNPATPTKPANPPPSIPAVKPVSPPPPPVVAGRRPNLRPNLPPRVVPALGLRPVVQPEIVFEPDVTFVNLPLLVRGDVTYLRQDFSVQQPVTDAQKPQDPPVNMRFDYLVRVRRATADELKAAKDAAPDRTYPQREAVLFALRGLTGRDAGETAEAWQRQVPDAEPAGQAARLAAELVRAEGSARQEALERLRDGKGPVYTDALAIAIGRLSGKSQTVARDALVARLTRMTAATLRNKLADESPEIRRAAALACAAKEDAGHVADLVVLLGDGEAAVRRAAGQALRELTGLEYTTRDEWREWWRKQQTE